MQRAHRPRHKHSGGYRRFREDKISERCQLYVSWVCDIWTRCCRSGRELRARVAGRSCSSGLRRTLDTLILTRSDAEDDTADQNERVKRVSRSFTHSETLLFRLSNELRKSVKSRVPKELLGTRHLGSGNLRASLLIVHDRATAKIRTSLPDKDRMLLRHLWVAMRLALLFAEGSDDAPGENLNERIREATTWLWRGSLQLNRLGRCGKGR